MAGPCDNDGKVRFAFPVPSSTAVLSVGVLLLIQAARRLERMLRGKAARSVVGLRQSAAGGSYHLRSGASSLITTATTGRGTAPALLRGVTTRLHGPAPSGARRKEPPASFYTSSSTSSSSSSSTTTASATAATKASTATSAASTPLMATPHHGTLVSRTLLQQPQTQARHVSSSPVPGSPASLAAAIIPPPLVDADVEGQQRLPRAERALAQVVPASLLADWKQIFKVLPPAPSPLWAHRNARHHVVPDDAMVSVAACPSEFWLVAKSKPTNHAGTSDKCCCATESIKFRSPVFAFCWALAAEFAERSKPPLCTHFSSLLLLFLYQKQFWKEDLMAGLSVTMVSIPLNLAIALGSGVPPEVRPPPPLLHLLSFHVVRALLHIEGKQ